MPELADLKRWSALTEQELWMLALETSGDVCSVALMSNAGVIEEVTFQHSMHLSERLMGTIEDLLAPHSLAITQITRFAVGVGPGSFTGTRIGITTAKTLAAVLKRPIYGISTLQAIAEPYCGIPGVTVITVLPCRKTVMFSAAYDVSNGVPIPRLAPDARESVEILHQIRRLDGTIILCGDGASAFTRVADATDVHIVQASRWPSAQSIGRLAIARMINGEPGDNAISLTPVYLAPPPISQPKIPIPQHPTPIKPTLT